MIRSGFAVLSIILFLASPLAAQEAAQDEASAEQDAAQEQSGGVHIAGVNPAQRPDWAPEITELQKPQNWRLDALAGVSEPYPESLNFLDNQGNWYTPFEHAGMIGPYDIRVLH